MADFFAQRQFGEVGYEKLVPEERDYIAVWSYLAEVENGALHQFFFNDSGDRAVDTLRALESLGAQRARDTLGAAIALFDPVASQKALPGGRSAELAELKSGRCHRERSAEQVRPADTHKDACG